MTKQKIKIDIVTDINCPWCYLGEERLKKAIEASSEQYEFDIAIKPFELSPNAPQEGEDKITYFKRNYGPDSLQRIEAGNKHLTELGVADGIVFNFDQLPVIHNTFNAHRLVWLAGHYGVQQQVVNALYKSNFTDAKNVNDPALLEEIGVAHGIPAERLNGFFASEEGKTEVKSLEEQAQRNGINGVPAFIFNDKYLVTGAQPVETLSQVFSQIAPTLQEINLTGDSCDVNGNC
jgi:predicted DsbA family dithiol-disulfide isomerase